MYLDYVHIMLGDQDKYWAPHKICQTCLAHLTAWSKGLSNSMPFSIPMVWREPGDHVTDCNFYAVITNGFNARNKATIKYPDLPSASRPILHCNELSAPIPGKPVSQCNYSVGSASPEMSDNDASYKDEWIPQQFSQIELNNLVHDLNLSKSLSELLAFRLDEKNLLMPDVKISSFRQREKDLIKYFIKEDDYAYCSDIKSLLNDLTATII